MTIRTHFALTLAAAIACGCPATHEPGPDHEPWPDPTAATLGDGDGTSNGGREPEPPPDMPEPGDGDGAPEPVGPGVCQSAEDPALLEQVASFADCPAPNQWICSLGQFEPNPVATVCCDQAPPYHCTMLAPAGDCLAVHWAACEV